jgi:hypothetical protein
MEHLEQKTASGPPFVLARGVRRDDTRPQSRRASAEVRTTNRPDAYLKKSLANKKTQESETIWLCSSHRKDRANIRGGTVR